MKQVGAIEVHQTLHGYDNGHSLLCASRALTSASAREMLILSDSSGSKIALGFETYLTAYPLSEEGSYVLARTWSAPEMKRPGCVWTHSLIIQFSDLASLENTAQLHTLLALLRRPSPEIKSVTKQVTLDSSSYKTAISCSLDDYSTTNPKGIKFEIGDTFSPDLLRDVLLGLYQNPVAPVFLIAENSALYEELVFSVWLQQWPRLRRQFSFCTGVSSNRRHGDRYLDLQIAPQSAVINLRREDASVLLYSAELKSGNSLQRSREQNVVAADEEELQDLSWLDVAQTDLSHSVNVASEFRRFLRLWGADMTEGRAHYALLGNVFAAIQEVNINQHSGEKELEHLLESMAQAFPRPKQAHNLKQQAFGYSDLTGMLRIAEAEILNALVLTPYYPIFGSGSLEIQSRVAALWVRDQGQAEALLLNSLQRSPNPLFKEVVRTVARMVTPAQARAIADRVPSLAVTFARQKLELLFSPELWNGSLDLRRDLFNYVTALDLNEDNQLCISAILFEAEADDLASDLARLYGEVAARGVLNYLSENLRPVSHPWRELLVNYPDLLVSWLQEQISLPALSEKFAAEVIVPLLLSSDPFASGFDSITLKNWIEFLGRVKVGQKYVRGTDDEVQKLFSDTSVWMLTAALQRSGEKASFLVERTFQTAHDALATGSVSFSAWRWLEKLVPSLYDDDWDRCHRLRLEFISQFDQKNWPLEQFTRAIKNEDTLGRVIAACHQTSRGKEFFRRLHKQVNNGKIIVPEWQRSIWGRKKKNIFSRFSDLFD